MSWYYASVFLVGFLDIQYSAAYSTQLLFIVSASSLSGAFGGLLATVGHLGCTESCPVSKLLSSGFTQDSAAEASVRFLNALFVHLTSEDSPVDLMANGEIYVRSS